MPKVTIEDETFDPQDHSTPRALSPATSAGTEVSPVAEGSRVSQGKKTGGVFDVPLAGRRSLIDGDPDYAALRKHLVQSARRSFRANETPLLYHLNGDDEVALYDELSALGKALQGQPGEPTLTSDEAYKPSIAHYQRLIDMLRPRLASLNLHHVMAGKPKMGLPYWGIDGDVTLSWDPEQYTQLAVLFRDEVESFLAYSLHPEDPPSETPLPRSSRRQRARATRESAEKVRIVTPDSSVADSPTKPSISFDGEFVHREQPASYATAANATPLSGRRTGLPEALQESPLTDRSDARAVREELAAGRTPYARRDSPVNELPHERHGSSRRLSEIFEDPPHLT